MSRKWWNQQHKKAVQDTEEDMLTVWFWRGVGLFVLVAIIAAILQGV